MGSKGRVSKSLYTRVVSKMVELAPIQFTHESGYTYLRYKFLYRMWRRLAKNYVKAKENTARKSCLGISWFVSLSVETFSFYKFSMLAK